MLEFKEHNFSKRSLLYKRHLLNTSSSLILVVLSFSNTLTYASETKEECIKRHDIMVNERILNDVVKSHEIDLTGYKEHTRKELQKELDLNPNNMEVNTLLHFLLEKVSD